MKVLIVVNRLFAWSQNFITRELVELGEQGLEIYTAARSTVDRKDLTASEGALRERHLPLPENPFTLRFIVDHLRCIVAGPGRYMRAWGALLNSGHSRPTNLGRSLVCLFRAAAVSGRVRNLGVQLIHAHFLTAPTETARYLSILLAIPYGCTAHAMDIYRDNSGNTKKLADASYVITCTVANAGYLLGAAPGIAGRLSTIYHGVNIPEEAGLPTFTARPFTFLAVGRLVPKKGFLYLVEACRELADERRDFRCVIVGEGPLDRKLADCVEELELGDLVRFTGFVPPREVVRYYRQGHALVVPSVVDENGDRDGLPNVCLEAMAQGLPVIGTDVSAIPEAVKEGVNGRLVPPRNPRALAAAMASLLDPDLSSAMGRASRKMAQKTFAIADNVRRLADVLRRHGVP